MFKFPLLAKCKVIKRFTCNVIYLAWFCLLFNGCSSTGNKLDASSQGQNQSAHTLFKPFFNQAEFVGLVSLPVREGGAIILDYELDGVKGGLVKFGNCDRVFVVDASTIHKSQRIFFETLNVNCQIAKTFLQGNAATESHWLNYSDPLIVDYLPASLLPDVAAVKQKKIIGGLEYAITKHKSDSIQLVVNDVEVFFTLMARGDFDGDGIEDLIIRSEWGIVGAFGRGVGWKILSGAVTEVPQN